MIEFTEKALGYTQHLDRRYFVSEDITYDATLRNRELICEGRNR